MLCYRKKYNSINILDKVKDIGKPREIERERERERERE